MLKEEFENNTLKQGSRNKNTSSQRSKDKDSYLLSNQYVPEPAPEFT